MSVAALDSRSPLTDTVHGHSERSPYRRFDERLWGSRRGVVLECVIVRERAFGNGLFGHALAFVPVIVTVPAQRVAQGRQRLAQTKRASRPSRVQMLGRLAGWSRRS